VPPAKYFIFALLFAGVLGAASALLAPAPTNKGVCKRSRWLLSALAIAASLVCVDVGLRYVGGKWPDLWLPATSDRLLLYSLILLAASVFGALSPGERWSLLDAHLAALAVSLFILLHPLTKSVWSSGTLAAAIVSWTVLGVMASVAGHALSRSLAPQVGLAAMFVFPSLVALVQMKWGLDVTQSMTTGSLAAIGTGVAVIIALRKRNVSESPAMSIWWGVLAISLASSSHYASLPPASGMALLASPIVAAAVAMTVRRKSLAVRSALAGVGFGACAAVAVAIALS